MLAFRTLSPRDHRRTRLSRTGPPLPGPVFQTAIASEADGPECGNGQAMRSFRATITPTTTTRRRSASGDMRRPIAAPT